MSDVSCRMFTFFQAAEKHGWITYDELLEGSPLSLDVLLDVHQRVPFDAWMVLCDRFGELVGEERLKACGFMALNDTLLGFFGPMMRTFGRPRMAYDIAVRWALPLMYRGMSATLIETGRDELEIVFRIDEGRRTSHAYLTMLASSFPVVPRFIGLQDATTLQVVVEDRESRVSLRMPPTRSFFWGIRRFFGALLSPSTIAKELEAQQGQIRLSHDRLRELEAHTEATLNAIPALVVHHHDGRVVSANQRAAEFFGVAAGRDLKLKSVAALFPGYDALGASRTSTKVKIEIAPVGAHPKRTLEVSRLPSVSVDEKVTEGLFAVDITDRLASEEFLERHETTLSGVATTLPELVLRVSAHGRVLDVLGGAHLVPDDERRDALTTLNDLYAAVPGLTRQGAVRAADTALAAIAHASPMTVELEGAKDGAAFILEVRAVPLGVRDEALLLLRDVTSKRDNERRLAVAERMSSLGTLAAGVGHEINNPLTFIMGNHDLLIESLDASSTSNRPLDVVEMRELVVEAREGTARVAEIVRALKSFSRVEDAERKAHRVSELVDEALQMARSTIKHRALTELHIDDDAVAFGNATSILQVLLNLIQNASQSMPKRDLNQNVIRISAKTHSDGTTEIVVADTGNGIPEAVRPRVFDPFFTTKSPGEGTGLGLSIAHRIVRDHDGTITVDSETGVGTTFTLKLPASAPRAMGRHGSSVRTPAADALAQEEQITSRARMAPLTVLATPPRIDHAPRSSSSPVGADAPRTPEVADKSLRIYVIDDDPGVLRMISHSLQRHDVVAVGSGKDAITAMATDKNVDVVLCDISMPDVDGVDVFEAVRALDAGLARRMVFMTGGVLTARTRDFLNAGGVSVLRKPLMPDDIRRVVQEIGDTRARPTTVAHA